MDFNKIMSGVKDSVGGQSNQDQSQDNNRQQQTDDQKWSDVGSSVKQALGDFQADQSKGEKPDYAEIGKAAKKAYDAYSTEDDKQDYAGIGKNIASGFMGGSGSKSQEQQQQQKDGDKQQEGQRPEEEKKESGYGQQADAALNAAEKFGISKDQAQGALNSFLK